MRFHRIVPFLLQLISSQTLAQTLSQKNAANEMSLKFAKCFAYYQFATYCAADHLDQPIKEPWTKIYEASSTYSYEFGRKAGHSPDEILATLKAAIDGLADETKKNCVALPRISSEYALHCGDLMDHPQKKFDELTAIKR